jgi:hypothetical protein
MRYIFDNEKSYEHLKTWAGNSQLEVAGFFFWNSGSHDQRSQAGLDRSLLFQALCRNPYLTHEVFRDELEQLSAERASKGRRL